MEVNEAIDRTDGDPVLLGYLLRGAPGSETAPYVAGSCVVRIQESGDFRLAVERDWAGRWLDHHDKSLPRSPFSLVATGTMARNRSTRSLRSSGMGRCGSAPALLRIAECAGHRLSPKRWQARSRLRGECDRQPGLPPAHECSQVSSARDPLLEYAYRGHGGLVTAPQQARSPSTGAGTSSRCLQLR